jgi:hypothetical protein
VLSVEVLGGLAMLPYGLCLTMRVTNNQVPPPDDKGQVGGELAGWLCLGCMPQASKRQRWSVLCSKPRIPCTQPPLHSLFRVRAPRPLQLRTALDYHIRVIIPCYKEPLDVIQKTVMAALVAPIPANCCRTGGWTGGRAARAGLACVVLAST